MSDLDKLISETHRYIVCGHTGKASAMLSEVYQELLCLAEILPYEKVQMLTKLFNVMLDAQQRNDMLYLADILRFEVSQLVNCK